MPMNFSNDKGSTQDLCIDMKTASLGLSLCEDLYPVTYQEALIFYLPSVAKLFVMKTIDFCFS